MNTFNQAEEDADLKGCSDGGCIIRKPAPGSMHTNGGCNCLKTLQYAFATSQAGGHAEKRRFQIALQYLQERHLKLKKLEEEGKA